MTRRLGTALALLLLAAGVSPAGAAEGPNLTLDARQYPGAPVVVTSFTSYRSVGGSRSHRNLCISFRPRGTQALTAVRFAVASLDEQGKEYQRMTIARTGTFEPTVVVSGDPAWEPRNCVAMNVIREDAPIVAVRLVAATYADGTTWTAPATDLPPLRRRESAPL